MEAVESRLTLVKQGSPGPRKLCHVQDIPEEPIWTELALALSLLRPPSTPPVEMAPKLLLGQRL